MALPSLGAKPSVPRPPALLWRGRPSTEGCVVESWGEFRWRSALLREALASAAPPNRPHNLDLARNTGVRIGTAER